MTQQQRKKEIERLLKQSRLASFLVIPAMILPVACLFVYAACIDPCSGDLLLPTLTLGFVLITLCAVQYAYAIKRVQELFREYEYFRIMGD